MTNPVSADLAEIRPQVERMAWAKTRDAPELFDDVAQEAMVAAWQERAAHPDAPISHAIRSARLRASKVLGGKPFTGEPRHPGREDAHDSATALVRSTADGEEFLLVDPVDRFADRDLAVSEVRASVTAAVRDLGDLDRQLVHLRFWEDREWSDVARILGRPAGTISRRWTEIVRPALALSLAEVIA